MRAEEMEVVNKLITNKHLVKIKITSMILASCFCFVEMVSFYYFSNIPIPPFMAGVFNLYLLNDHILMEERLAGHIYVLQSS
jgi:hypothetical protein